MRPVQKGHWTREARTWSLLLHKIFQTPCPHPAAGSGRTEVAEMIEQRSPVTSAEGASVSVIAKNSIEEELAPVPMEAEAQAAQATMPAPVLPLVRQSRAPPEEGTAFQAPAEPDHAKLREEAIRTERERLAPERVREIAKAYERLAMQKMIGPNFMETVCRTN